MKEAVDKLMNDLYDIISTFDVVVKCKADASSNLDETFFKTLDLEISSTKDSLGLLLIAINREEDIVKIDEVDKLEFIRKFYLADDDNKAKVVESLERETQHPIFENGPLILFAKIETSTKQALFAKEILQE